MTKGEARGAGTAHAGHDHARLHQPEHPHDTAADGPLEARTANRTRSRKDEWLRRCNGNRELPLGAFKALFFIADAESIRKKGFSYFGVPAISAGTGMSASAVRRAIRCAKRLDLLRVRRRGLEETNEYWPCLDGRPLVGAFPPEIARADQARGYPKMNTPQVSKNEQRGYSKMNTRGIQKWTPNPGPEPRSRTPESKPSPSSQVAARAQGEEIKILDGKSGGSVAWASEIKDHHRRDARRLSTILGQKHTNEHKSQWPPQIARLEVKGLAFVHFIEPAAMEAAVRGPITASLEERARAFCELADGSSPAWEEMLRSIEVAFRRHFPDREARLKMD